MATAPNPPVVAAQGKAAYAAVQTAPEGQSIVLVQAKGYYAHYGTTNRSFAKVSEILASKGVRNNLFMLALFDPELDGVDPRDPSLSVELQARILAEIVKNPWYFLREVVKVPVSGGAVPYELHLGNLFLTWCMISNISCYLLLPRQNYKTVSACAMYLWMYAFGTTNSHMLFFNKELGDAQNNLKRVKDLQEELPTWLRDDVLTDPINDRNNVEYIYSAHRKNRIDPKPAGKDLAHADKLGRGTTTPNVWYDEMAFAKYIRETYMAAAPAQSQARANAIRMGVPYGTVITTTPNSQDDPSGEFAYMVRNGALHFRLEFYDFGPAKVRQMIDEQAEYNFLYAEYHYHEIGRSEAWFKEQCRELLNDQVKIKRELLLVWPMTTDGAVFTEDQMDKLSKYKKETVASLPIRPRKGNCPPNLEFVFTEMPDLSIPYLLSIDTSGGVGQDYTAFVLSHPDDMRQVAVMKTNTADDEALRAISEHLMVDIFPKAIAVIERNYLGIVVINHLVKVPGLEPRIFYLEKEKEAERTVGKLVVKQKRKVRVYGVDTTADSREAMFRHLFQIMDEHPHLICCSAIQDEVRTLHRKKTGKIEHRAGFHDDQLMAWLIAVYADRHEQPVLRGMLGRMRTSKVQQSMDVVAALNIVGDKAPVPAAMTGQASDMTLDVYTAREAARSQDEATKRRNKMAAMVASLNDGFTGEIPS
jgi:hypothetical protein